MLEEIVDIATDLCANLAAEDRYRRLVAAIRRIVPCDSTAILRLDGDVLLPVAFEGLVPEVAGRRFPIEDQPRFAKILRSSGPVRFPDDSLPDPFDGCLTASPGALTHVHACMGCRLVVDGTVVGALAVDALDPHAFDALDDRVVAMLGALAGAALRTARLVDALERTARHSDLVARQLLRDAEQREGGEILGVSPAIRRVRGEVTLAASSDLAVLITGETGVGKEVVARAVHAQSPRRDRPLIYVNCAALPESIAESELFGHIRGAFTGAVDQRAGKFEAADGGTLFLDEIGELAAAVQPKFLRALQSGEIQRVGADRTLEVDVRVIAATNRNLDEEVAAGRFRSDLYHRLSVLPLRVPPLRERREDVPILAGFFLDAARGRLGLGPVRLSPQARTALAGYDWPGNVRELEHVLLRASLHAAGGRRHQAVVIEAGHLDLEHGHPVTAAAPPLPSPASEYANLTLREATDLFERHLIEDTVRATGGNFAEAARRLGLHRANLHRLAKRLGLTTD